MTDTLLPVRRPIFAIFQVGDAKGVAHIGAMDAAAAAFLDEAPALKIASSGS